MTAMLRGTVIGSTLDPREAREPQLAQRRKRDPLRENLIGITLDLCERSAVNGSHDQAGTLRFSVTFGKLAQGLGILGLGAFDLEFLQVPEFIGEICRRGC